MILEMSSYFHLKVMILGFDDQSRELEPARYPHPLARYSGAHIKKYSNFTTTTLNQQIDTNNRKDGREYPSITSLHGAHTMNLWLICVYNRDMPPNPSVSRRAPDQRAATFVSRSRTPERYGCYQTKPREDLGLTRKIDCASYQRMEVPESR